MKESTRLRAELEKEENDLVAFGLIRKIIRAERMENFQEKWLPKIQGIHNVRYVSLNEYYSIETNIFGVIDFYPKSNRLLFRVKNSWKNKGLEWIIKNLKIEESK